MNRSAFIPTKLRILSLDELRRIYVERAMAEISKDMADSPLNEGAAILCSSSPPLVIPGRVTTEMLVDAARAGVERSAASRAVHFILQLIARASSIPFAELDKASREK